MDVDRVPSTQLPREARNPFRNDLEKDTQALELFLAGNSQSGAVDGFG